MRNLIPKLSPEVLVELAKASGAIKEPAEDQQAILAYLLVRLGVQCEEDLFNDLLEQSPGNVGNVLAFFLESINLSSSEAAVPASESDKATGDYNSELAGDQDPYTEE